MQRLIVGLLLLALVGAGATVWLVNSYIDRRIQATAKKVDTGRSSRVVLVARENIPIGKKIEGKDLDWIAWPDKGVQGNFISSTAPDGKKAASIVGTVARRGIIKGTPMTEASVFRSATPGFLAGMLDPSMRAISISVTPESSASGFIMPGDRVDLILMQEVNKNLPGKSANDRDGFRPYARYTAETVLQNLRVLAVDQKVDDFDNKKAQVSKTVTLEVTPKQAETVSVARAMGKLGLALRSLVDNQPSAASGTKPMSEMAAKSFSAADPSAGTGKKTGDEGATVTTDLEISPVLAASVATAAGPARSSQSAPVRQAPRSSPIKIYRGGQPSTVNF